MQEKDIVLFFCVFMSSLRDFLKKVGLNFILKDLSLSFTYIKLYNIVAESTSRSDWSCIAAEVRNYFKGSLEVEPFNFQQIVSSPKKDTDLL